MSIAMIVLHLALIIFSVEGLMMLVLPKLAVPLKAIGIESELGLASIDAAGLTLIAIPIIYFWVIRPFVSAQHFAERTLREAIETLSEGFLMCDAEGHLLLSNIKFRELYAMTSDDSVMGRRLEDMLPTGLEQGHYPVGTNHEEACVAERLKQHSSSHTPVECQAPNGRWVKISTDRTSDGFTTSVFDDINDLKMREFQLRENESLYRSLIELSPDGIMVLYDSGIVFCNTAFASILGTENLQHIIGRNELDFVPTEYHAAILESRNRVSGGDTVELREMANRRLDGSLVFVERTVTAISWHGQAAFLILTRDITERKKQEAQLRRIVGSLQEGFVLYDHDSRIVMWNEKWLAFHPAVRNDIKVGMTFEEFVRLAISRGQFPEAAGREEEFIAERVSQHQNPRAPLIRHRPDGRWYLINEGRTDDGGIFALNVDITDLKNAENVAEEARLRAENADKSKSEFLANMSHELRTPLNAIIGFSDLIKQRDEINIAVDRIPEYIDAIYSSGQYLLSLINDILDFSKSNVGKLKLQEETVNLGRLFNAVFKQIAHVAEISELRLTFPPVTDLPDIKGDKLRLRQILLNLLSNAINFTPLGGEVRVSVSRGDGGEISIAVSDTGIGMSPEELKTLGQPFQQFQRAYSRKCRGTGLGVSLSKALAELHDGSLEYTSERGKGTTATLILPAHRVIPTVNAMTAVR